MYDQVNCSTWLGQNREQESRLRDLELTVEHLQGIVNRDKELDVKEVVGNYESLVRKMWKTIFFISVSLSQHRGAKRAEK